MPQATKNQDIAHKFLQHQRFRKNLLYCKGWDTFYIYTDGWYEGYEPNDFREMVWEFIQEHYPDINVRSSLITDIYQQIKWGAYRKVDSINTPYVAFKDKLYNLNKFEWEEFDRQKIAVHRINFDSKEIDMPIPKFEEFLNTTIIQDNGRTDDDLIDLVQEMFGYYLLNNLKAQTVFFLVGKGANGKSVMVSIIEKMIGTKFVSAMSIQALTLNQFATSALIGKKINICNEEESKFLRSDKFKALVSGDLIQAERKHEQQFAFRPITKYLFASNQLPTFEGINYGIRRRMIILPFKKVFSGAEQNRNLSEELLKELPGIVNWAIIGAKRLVKNNYQFSETKASYESREDFENITSSALYFFRHNFVADKDGIIPNEDLYKEYREWCEENGKRPMSSISFHRDITVNLDILSETVWVAGKAVRGKKCSRQRDIVPDEVREVEELLKDEDECEPKLQL